MKVLIIDTIHEILIEKLQNKGFNCDYLTNLSRNEIEEIICNYEGIILRSKFVLDQQILEKAKNLKFIGRVGAGMENIDVNFATNKGIKCINSPEGNRDAVGEQALGMLLILLNKMKIADNEVRNGLWKREENRGIEIKGKTVGIIGYGNMGGAFARRLKGFGANVIAYDKYKTGFSDDFATEVQMEKIYSETDFLSLHVPLAADTKFLVNNSYINRFQKNIFVINTARGKVIKTSDLVKNIKSGKVLGAALDVLEYESSSFEDLSKEATNTVLQYLINSDKTILTPHIAGWTHESKIKLSEILAEKIIKLFK